MASWLDEIAGSKLQMENADLLEIGTQDLSIPYELLDDIVRRRAGIDSEPVLREMYANNAFQPGAQEKFYRLLGVASYASIDLHDSRADIRHDMNLPLNVERQFDVITNFGTAEHIFNVFQFFDNVHRLLKAGGTALHVLPACGDVNHGFYNFHLIFFHRLAKANNYDILDYRYVDNIAYKSFGRTTSDVLTPYSFDRITQKNMDSNDEVRVAAYERLLENSKSAEAMACEPQYYFTVFDYSFVALRKNSEHPLVQPQQ